MLSEKTCTRCLNLKSISLFSPRKTGSVGWSSWCKQCYAESAKERRLKDITHARNISNKSRNKNKDIVNQRQKQYRLDNLEKYRLRRREFYANNKEKELAKAREWKEKNRDRLIEYQYKKYWDNVEESRRKQNEYLKTLPDSGRSRVMKRIAIKKMATVKWADEEKIKEIYKSAYDKELETNVKHEVDHIVPLQNKLVCGLHWEGNLQILTKHENRKKCNKWWPDMPS